MALFYGFRIGLEVDRILEIISSFLSLSKSGNWPLDQVQWPFPVTLTYPDKMACKTFIVTGTRLNDNNIVSIQSPISRNYRVLDFGLLCQCLAQCWNPVLTAALQIVVICYNLNTSPDGKLDSPRATHSIMQLPFNVGKSLHWVGVIPMNSTYGFLLLEPRPGNVCQQQLGLL